MFVIKEYHLLATWCLIYSTFSQRRIHNGFEITKPMPFAVYLLKAAPSERKYQGWTCGGSIVTREFIITSAACVEDVKHLYVVAGYSKFVEAEDIDKDPCTQKRKKKVIFTCVPKAYEFDFTKIEEWAVSDIAVIQVESPYDFRDESYVYECSYIPAPIRVNFERKYQEPGVEAMVLGWGHLDEWRSMTDLTSHNVETLHYASTTILDKFECKEAYKTKDRTPENNQLLNIIDKYMICTLGEGNIDDRGELVVQSIPELDGCITKIDKLKGVQGVLCEGSQESPESEDSDEIPIEVPDSLIEVPETRTRTSGPVEESSEDVVEGKRSGPVEKRSEDVVEGKRKVVAIGKGKRSRRSFRRNGICQNDHGGPLVTWVGGHEVLIGVASVFKVINSTCAGPYLFTSTQCNGKFLDCLLYGGLGQNKYRRSCDGPAAEVGFEMIKRRISWIGHPDGPAANEVIETRPQVPISKFYPRQ